MNKRWKIILAFCGVFLAGAVVGGLAARRGLASKAPPPRHGSGRSLESFAPSVMRRYTARLELDEAQREQLREIVHQAERELRELRGNTFQETIAIGDKMNAQVERLLRSDQRDRFETLKQDVQKYWERERIRREQAQRPGDNGKREPRPGSGHSEKRPQR
ncbi:hypothetical protein AXK11_03710 [Cephaloticoccus primus]|uniref:Periplasmic heavy metal sensor n=1 Tax=Cephaloticoccus primus TaxID=1548207 RepID=A0A139SQ37_9BACT|nr:hypothetical protein [Cephaloticoccus primus]KXU36647.1 hypothetical protein AXK11_03710 [Cephaloticoccus primus]